MTDQWTSPIDNVHQVSLEIADYGMDEDVIVEVEAADSERCGQRIPNQRALTANVDRSDFNAAIRRVLYDNAGDIVAALHEVDPIRATVSHDMFLFISPAVINVSKNWGYMSRQKAQPCNPVLKDILQEV